MIGEFRLPGTEVHIITASKSGYPYQIAIRQPIDYATSDKSYPVLYMLDSNWYFPLASSVVQTMRIIPNEQYIQDPIIVGIGYDTPRIDLQTALRSRDYTPTRNDEIIATMREQYLWEKVENTSGEAAMFLHFIRNDIIPFIDNNYRTDRTVRLSHGHSFGGLFMLYTLFNQPDTFHRYMIASPSIWWDNKTIQEHEAKYASQNGDLNALVHLTAGTNEPGTLSDTAALVKQLITRKYASLQLDYDFMSGEIHSTIVARTIIEGLRKLLPAR